MINFANKKYKNVRFENKDILSSKINERFDYVIINGTFNIKINQNFNWIKKTLKILFKKTDKADFPIFENILFVGPSTSRGHPVGPKIVFDPKNHFNVLKITKLELPNHFGSVS